MSLRRSLLAAAALLALAACASPTEPTTPSRSFAPSSHSRDITADSTAAERSGFNVGHG
jgi:hypothetical protein